jgi:hypothetical protein
MRVSRKNLEYAIENYDRLGPDAAIRLAMDLKEAREALGQIWEQARRHKRGGTEEKKYLLRDLEFIEEWAGKCLPRSL